MVDEVVLVVRCALLSRFLLLVVQAVFNEYILDYDSSAFIEDKSNEEHGLLDRIFGGFAKWDAAYFLKIAQEGYTYEQYMAFFPLQPWILRASVKIVQPVSGFFVDVKQRSLYITCGWILNTIYFTGAAISLYNLTFCLFRKTNVALITSIVFCCNPASVFFSSLYTESLFSFLQFTALYYLEQSGMRNEVMSLLLFALGCATRSNGILSCGFIAHRMTKHFLNKISFTSTGSSIISAIFQYLYSLSVTILKLIIFNGIVLMPYVLFQLYGYHLYCGSSALNKARSHWCNKALPFSYSYIQDNYWDVGFLRYFEMKQIPNFLLAAPMISLCTCAVMTYFCDRRNHQTIRTLDLASKQNIRTEDCEFYHSSGIFVYLVHLAFMVIFGFTYMHVQVITRFICSASPLMYWYSAHVIIQESTGHSEMHSRCKWKSLVILGYFLLYFFIGSILHCNFYPWT